jgi:regulatory protein
MEGIITSLEPSRGRGGCRINVYLDGRFGFSVQQEVAAQLRVGQSLFEARIADLLAEDERARALDAALRFLAYRPRSEREIRDRLARRGVLPAIVDGTVARLKQLKLVDDEAFAQYWIEQRQEHRPSGRRLLRVELQRKGLDSDTSAQALDAVGEHEDPVEAASRAGLRKARALRGLDERTFMQRLGQFLLRRGFDYDTCKSACRRLWAERQ